MKKDGKRRGKGGFTLVELAVTLVVLSILFAIAVPNLLGYIHLSQFRRNESCAKTMYLSAESALTYCRTGGEWESFCRRVKDEGVLNRSFDEADGEQKKLSGRIYGIRLDADEYASGELSGDGSLVDELLSQDTYDKSLLNAAICIEIDVESGHVYSVFYGTSCKGLYYGSNALSQPAELSGEWLDMDSRASYDLRRAERLGYYSVQDAVNVVNLDAAKLKITSINLVNGETLSLGWSSSVRAQNRANVYYEVKLYSSADKALLLTIRVPGSALKTGAQPLEVTAEDGTKKNYTFPIEYDQTTGRASLVLDGMMNAQLYSRLDELSAEDEAAFRQSSSTSITRFGGKLAAPAEVYATVQAFPDPNAAYDSGEMYQKSDVIDSNRANTLFGDGTSADGTECEVKAFRHLSNIRYMDKAAEISVAARSLDWTSDSVRVYGTAAHGALTVSSGTDIGFPSIPELKTGQTLNGAGGLLNRIAAVFTGGNAVSSLRLDATSIDAHAEYLGLFQKNSGTIRGLRLLSPQVDVSSATLRGVGAVCGYSRGSLESDSVDGADARVRAALTAADAEGIGGVAGVIEGNGKTTGLSASGAVTGTLPVSGEARGIGGIAGSLTVSGTAVKNLTSRASVTGNRSAGGIAGYLAGSGQPTRQDLRDCTNEGLVLSSADADKTSLAGRYIGGIVGYAYHASLGGCTSRAGRAADYEYTQADRSRLRGRYVGGIVGYSNGSVLYRCSTGADGYVLGSEYVGGIIGGANEGADSLLLHDGTARVTSNASCVIGNSYVGGIIGRNSGGSAIENCVNTGVAAGYQTYIGGICGANEKNASIVNCASYVSDTDGAVYRRVTGWGASGSYAGGLTGYNSGSIVFDKKSAVSTRSVAGIVVGRDYVGGLVGYNDADGTIDVDYTLIGGSVFASGDCAGGLAGLNASTSLLGQTLTVKPASVQGRYYVGGAIGANVVDPDTDITVSGLRVDNSLGSVTAEAFCGGLIGYQRTYTEKDRADRALYALLPGIAENGDNVPGAVTASTNPHTVTITADGNSAGRLSVVSSNMTIRAYAYAGGIVGCGEPQSRMQVVGCLNAGGFDRPADGVFPDSRLKTGVNLAAYLRTQGHEDAAQALSDESGADTLRVSIVGGIVGVNGKNHVIDRCASRGTMNGLDAMGGVVGLNEGRVTANTGAAGGIVGISSGESTVENCYGDGSVASSDGYAGGIAGENLGRIQNCAVGSGGAAVTLTTRSRTAAGAVCAVNHKGGTVSGAEIGDRVTISGSAFLLGALVGDNSGTVADAEVAQQPEYDVSASALQVGGAVGINRPGGTVRSVRVTSDFKGFSRYQYLGGVVGQNCAPSSDGTAAGKVENCTYSGAITEGKSAAANCYGGIAGVNGGLLSGNTVSALTLTADGVYTATATSSASDKERLSTHIGGIAGKNDTTGIIEQCYIDNTRTGSITVKNGMVGGVTGYNKGTVALSGDKSTEALMANVREVSELLANAKSLSADSSWVKWEDGADIEELTYASSGKPVAQGRTMQIIVTGNGSLGGIAGCNAPSGALERCVSGNWLLVNRSDSISVGTGGIIGMNESEKDLSFLLNRAFVGRQLRRANTNRFAGGIIGTQTNRTTADWLIEGCINYGTVYGCLSHYSGGIIGQWTNNGGTLERCYNYGNLQTTFKANWVGASGGIVAQLYHASSGQDFNILSCQNHGSLYGRNGQSVADCANDSGGILGNVTAYAADAGKGQAFTINVADCVNGPGVEIYSGSMASGIVGFFSADGVANITVNSRAQQLITNATENITLNIDRCRNYAKTLSGYNFTAGIFGDRYAYGRTQPATDTYIQNCFSVTPGQKDREIVFMHSGGSDTLDAKKTGNNYYFDDAWGITNQYASGGIASGYARSESRRAYSRMLGYGLFDQRLFAAVAGPTLGPVDSFATTSHGMYYNMTPSNTSIDGHGIMTETSSGKIVGRVIYDMPYSYEPYVFDHGGSKLQQAVKTRNGGASGMDAYARTAYRDFEHGRTDGGALDGSFDVSLRQNSEGGFEVSITDDDRPLYYEGRVSVDGREVLSGLRFIPKCKGQGLWDPELNGTQAYGAGTTEGTFQLPAGLENDTAGQSITLSVRAVSLFEDTAPSAWKQAQTVDVSVLPTPDISIRLTGHENASRSNGWKESAVYRLSLNNLADYAPFGGWKVVCRLGSQTVTLDKSHPAAEIRGGGLQELIVTASADVTNGIQPASVTRTIPIDTPAYRPDGSISSLTASYSGSTAADFTVTAALTVRETTMETPPVYRIELLGTVGGQEYVFAHEDVLTSAGSTVTANFRDLPVQYFADTVQNRRVRAWYAASGLGPVITYGETRQSGDAAVTLRTYSASGEQQPDRTIYSHVLGSPKDFADYIASTALQIKPLAAPVLNAPELSRSASGSISYRFSWTQPGQGAAKARYSVRLTGITADRARVGIPLGEVYTDSAAKEFTVSADDWQYAAVELTVTRLGQAYGEVGLSASQTCLVKQRLPRPGQPSVSNPDTNELVYDISWRASGRETGCAGYRIYVQPKGGQAEPLGALVPAGGGSYSVKRSLEQYAGKTVDLYLVAEADDTGYANSPNGIVYTMTVPERLPAPRVKWAYSWLGDASSDPVAASDFRNGGLTVTVTPQDAASMPPGGSTCLLRAVIYDENLRELGTYPVSAMRESGDSYVCTLSGLDTKYAGRSIRFETRISQSAGQVSSAWVEGETVILPRVRLDTPAASLANVNETVRVTYGQANLMIYQADWTALLTTLSWREVENADRYTIILTDQAQKSALVSVDMSGGQPLITVSGQTPAAESGGWYNVKPGSTVTGRYSLTGGSIRYYSYQLNTMLRAEDGVFTLKLPNLFSMTTHDNQTLSLSDVQIRQVSVTADSTSTRYAASDAAEREFS